jgi:NADH-quinone oxidoreductase subunit I
MVDCKAVKREQRSFGGKTFEVSVVPRVKHASPPKKVTLSLMGLLQGMWLTLTYLRPKKIVTQQYPENRDTLTFPERYRAALRFKLVPSDEAARHTAMMEQVAQRLNADVSSLEKAIRQDQKPSMYHKCTGCGSCQEACPNGSINVVTRYSEITEDREIDQFVWRMDSCLYCNACVQACPFDAIEMSHGFENAVYDRRLLVYNLNQIAGPPANMIELEDDPEIRKRMIDKRERYGGPVPMNGHPLPNLRPLDMEVRATPINGKSQLREAQA